jgi:phosphoglycolate phosphatase
VTERATAGLVLGRPLRLLVFDLDGTLVDSVRDLATAVNEALERAAPGTPPLSLAEVRAFVGEGARVLVERSLKRARVDRTVDELLPLFLETYRRHLLDTTRLYPGVSEALDRMRGLMLAVLTNKPGDLSRRILEGLGVASRFARIWGPEDARDRKPGPDGLQRLMRELGMEAAQTAMVGDSPIDVATGRAAGALTVGVTYGLDPEALRADPPEILVGDLRELADRLER